MGKKKELLKSVTINGKVADLTRIKTLTIGDQEDLENRGLDLDTFGTSKVTGKAAIELLVQFLPKANKEITREDVRSITFLEISRIIEAITERIVAGTIDPND